MPSQVIAAEVVDLLSDLSLVGSVQDAITGAPITGCARCFELLIMTGGIISGVGIAITRWSRSASTSRPSRPRPRSISRPPPPEYWPAARSSPPPTTSPSGRSSPPVSRPPWSDRSVASSLVCAHPAAGCRGCGHHPAPARSGDLSRSPRPARSADHRRPDRHRIGDRRRMFSGRRGSPSTSSSPAPGAGAHRDPAVQGVVHCSFGDPAGSNDRRTRGRSGRADRAFPRIDQCSSSFRRVNFTRYYNRHACQDQRQS